MSFTVAPMPKSPGELLELVLMEKGLGKADLQQALGVKAWTTINNWSNNKGFDAKNQARVCAALNLPADYFARPDETARRERAREAALAAFLETPLGQSATEDERLSLRSTVFPHGIPSPELYGAYLLTMRGMLRRPPEEVAAENAAINAALADKGNPFRSK